MSSEGFVFMLVNSFPQQCAHFKKRVEEQAESGRWARFPCPSCDSLPHFLTKGLAKAAQ